MASERKTTIDDEAPKVRTVPATEPPRDPDERLNIKRGDKVLLLEPLWDGVAFYNAGEVIHWPLDTPPVATQATLPEDRATRLNAPVFADATAPAGYVDARTGETFVVAPGEYLGKQT